MKAKTFEIRDRGTFIPALAVQLDPVNEKDRFLLARAGYGRSPYEQRTYVVLARLAGGKGESTCDPHDWGGRTMPTAHQHIIKEFDALDSGAVVDVEFLLGETSEPKSSEAVSEDGH